MHTTRYPDEELLVLVVVVRAVDVLEVVVVVHLGQPSFDDRSRMRKFLHPFENAFQRPALFQTLGYHLHHLLSTESYSAQRIPDVSGILFLR